MNIVGALKVINRMKADGVIQSYAIGGAVGATFYLEPISTLDVDVFIHIEQVPGSLLLSLGAVFEYLQHLGYSPAGEYVMIEGWPVQFLATTGALADEALADAVVMRVDDTPVWVFSPEHLAAIALETGRVKDTTRLLQFLQAGALSMSRFESIVDRNGLGDRWTSFQEQHPLEKK
ncbi:MAG: hypothetical protein IPP94_03625 [Ignavibacteria bacterium]|nr:hypothetical protein [Ignavibacteria bacterium]